MIARYTLNPNVLAASSMLNISGAGFHSESVNINALIEELNKQTEQVRNKDLSRAEEMMTAQVHTLDLIFRELANRAIANMRGGYPEAANTCFKLAMKVQTQCKSKWEPVAKIQNPSTTHVTQQTNIAKNQQINNGQEIENPPNELLGKTYGQRLDTRTQGEAVKAYSTVDALEEIHSSQDN